MKKIIIPIIVIVAFFTSCVKKVDPIDGNNATITLTNGGANYVVDNITVNPNDSIFFKFTISSDIAMKFVGIQKNPANQTAFVVRDTLTTPTKSYTVEKRLKADSINGTYLYRMVAHDAAGNYIGAKDLIITVKTDFNFYSYRFLQVPDSTAKTNTCYLAASTGVLYSYSNGAAKSADIDLGFLYDTTVATANKFSLYALSAPQSQLNFYDISSWTKNITIMKKIATPAFNTLTSGGALRSAGVTNLASGTTTKITQLAAGNLVYFKTAAGKVGCLQVNFINGTNEWASSYINVDVKIEK